MKRRSRPPSTSPPTADRYRDDLAKIHDAGFGELANHAALELLSRLGSPKALGDRVVDLGCGSGILAERLSTAGYQVLGIDYSPAMLALARQRAPRAEFRLGSYLGAEIPTCRAVTAIGEVFNYRFAGSPTPAKLGRLFRKIHRALEPDGWFLFDVAGPGRGGPARSRSHRTEGDDWVCLAQVDEDPAGQTLERRITTFRRCGELFRRDDELHRLRLFPAGSILDALRTAGFRARRLPGYGTWRFPPGWSGFLARKACATPSQ